MQREQHLHSNRLLAICIFAGACFGQLKSVGNPGESLCSLQKRAAEGTHETARVSGIFEGLDIGTLEDAACPNEATWVELALLSGQNKDKLRTILKRSRRAYVLVEGEFYGPPTPDPKLPEGIRKAYHPGWGHLAAFRTKLVVHTILEATAVPKAPTKFAP